MSVPIDRPVTKDIEAFSLATYCIPITGQVSGMLLAIDQLG